MADARTSDDPNDSFASWISGFMTPEQAAASSGPVVQAPTATNVTKAYDANAGNESVAGPYDKFRNQKPADIDQTWWNQYIDSRNYAFQNLPDQPRKDAATKTLNGMTTADFVAYARKATPQDLARDGGKYAPKVNAEQASIAAGIPTVQPNGALRGAPAPGANPQAVQQQANITAATAKADADTKAANDANRKQQEDFWSSNVDPALIGQRQSVADQISGNRQSEQELGAAGDKLRGDLAATQGQRTAGIASSNAESNAALGQYKQSNAASNQFYDQNLGTLTSKLGQYDQEYDQNLGTYKSALNQNNGELDRNLAGLKSALNGNNAELDQNLNALKTAQGTANASGQGALTQLQMDLRTQNGLGDLALSDLKAKFDNLNGSDRAAYMKYLNDTDPLLAEQFAQQANPEYVKNQEDAVAKWKDLSNPEISATERLMAEQSRQKFENDDKSSRDAAFAQLQGRGLDSGGQQIAQQYATRQQQGQERALAQLGLAASAEQRGIEGLQGYTSASGQLRSADDAMKQYQDTFAQNDKVRRANLSNQQNQAGLATNKQIGDRGGQVFDASRATVNDQTQRSGMGFDAARATNNDEFGRAGTVYDAGYGTAGAKAQNAGTVYNAGYGTAGAKAANAGSAFGAGVTTTGAKVANAGTVFQGGVTTQGQKDANSQGLFDNSQSTTAGNFGRSAYGWDTADKNSGTGYDASKVLADTRIANRAGEVGSASGLSGTMLGAAGTKANIGGGLTADQIKAINAVLGNTIVGNTPLRDEDEN